MTLVYRLMGFYPASATRANDFTRVGKYQQQYALEISSAYKTAYIKAAMANGGKGDRAAMQAVLDQVEWWNEAAQGTGLEIANFRKNMARALKEAKLPAGERFLKAAPKAMRDQASTWMQLYGADQ